MLIAVTWLRDLLSTVRDDKAMHRNHADEGCPISAWNDEWAALVKELRRASLVLQLLLKLMTKTKVGCTMQQATTTKNIATKPRALRSLNIY